MKLDIEEYAGHRVFIKIELDKKGHDKYQEIASYYSALSSIPVYCAYYYIGEIVGFDSWLIIRMDEISKFYGYTEIVTKYSNYE